MCREQDHDFMENVTEDWMQQYFKPGDCWDYDTISSYGLDLPEGTMSVQINCMGEYFTFDYFYEDYCQGKAFTNDWILFDGDRPKETSDRGQVHFYDGEEDPNCLSFHGYTYDVRLVRRGDDDHYNEDHHEYDGEMGPSLVQMFDEYFMHDTMWDEYGPKSCDTSSHCGSDRHCCAQIMGEVAYHGYEEFTRCVDIETVDNMGHEQNDDMWMEMHCRDHPDMKGAMHMFTSGMTFAALLAFISFF